MCLCLKFLACIFPLACFLICVALSKCICCDLWTGLALFSLESFNLIDEPLVSFHIIWNDEVFSDEVFQMQVQGLWKAHNKNLVLI